LNWDLIGDIGFWTATAATTTFCLLYFLFAPWWSTMAGRNIMAVMGSVALAFAYFSWAIALGHVPPGFWPMRALLFFGIALAVGWRILIFIRYQIIRPRKAGKKERTDELEDAR
jgi:hypothetical protein